jgi:Flp pilus assembly protein TadG
VKLARLRRNDSGQAILEVALIAPVMILLLIGAIDLGRLSQFDTKLAASARAGAQFGASNLVNAANDAGMVAAALNEAQSNAALPTVVATSYCECYGGTATTCTVGMCASSHRLLFVKVTASGKFVPIFHYFKSMDSLTPSRTVILQVGQ